VRAFFAEGQFETDEGERLTLVCDFSALDVIEQVTGQNWDEIVPQLVDPPRALAVKVLYGLLRKRHDRISLDEVAGLFFDKNAIALWAVMGEVIARACHFDKGEDDEAKPAKKKPRGQSRSTARSG
jgi:hypothetical protein